MLFEVSFKQYLPTEEHQYTRRSFLFFLKKARPKKKNNNQHQLFDNRANKNEAINILGF